VADRVTADFPGLEFLESALNDTRTLDPNQPHDFVAHCVKHGVPKDTLRWALNNARELARQLPPMRQEERYQRLRNHLLKFATGKYDQEEHG
jgi:hypothetical protein